MLDPRAFLEQLQSHGINFFAGVPDSLLKNFCACVDDVLPEKQHIITANEGGAIAVAAGHNVATGTVPVVYMQNSGLGNTVNPLLSLADPAVYSIPMLLIIGWRGEPGVPDEPQHVKQGPVTSPLLSCMDIAHTVLPETDAESKKALEEALRYVRDQSAPYAFLIRKGTFGEYKHVHIKKAGEVTREAALEAVLNVYTGAIFVGTTGKLSRELFELREKRGEGHAQDFLTVGSMGHASQIALGIAEAKPERQVVCLDGDGAALMHLGGMATIGTRAPKNLLHIVFDNGAHESVGGQNVTGKDVPFATLAKALGYSEVRCTHTLQELTSDLVDIKNTGKLSFVHCHIRPGSRDDLGRPTVSPQENKQAFQEGLNT